jgi:hypothetical protein
MTTLHNQFKGFKITYRHTGLGVIATAVRGADVLTAFGESEDDAWWIICNQIGYFLEGES